MGLLGSIVSAPVTGPLRGVLWIVRTLAEHAERELYDEDRIRKDLLRLEQEYELGKLALEDFEREEAALLERLNEARRMKEGR